MSPGHLKATALALTLTSLTLFAVAAGDYFSGGAGPAGGRPRSGWRGGVVLMAVTIAVGGTLWLVSWSAGWSLDRVFWVGCGVFIGVLTVLRPWWFWEHYKARWLRRMIGDAPTAALYLVVAAVCIWVGLNTEWTFGRR